ncbi:hypothetical protein [uncultured Rikenella sp.]|uniref:hypothetical protein n=1 Tax=uncultured Rikenella sp. TaxID=368003 RepID=UPI00260FB23E|nr:hypothetical protein [uncultured Rikenella sp.]
MPLGINGKENPAPGYRDYGPQNFEGLTRSVCNSGYSWSSATSSIQGLDLGFYAQGFNSGNADYRGRGLQLRCLSE